MTHEPDKVADKDLTDQIRTVHLTLVLVAFVLLATSLQEPKRKIERSISDAREIYSVVSSLSPTAGPVGKEVEETVYRYIAQSGNELQKGKEINLEITWPTGNTQIMEIYGDNLAWLYLSDGIYEREDDIDHPAYSYIPFQVRSLGDFIRFWDHNSTDQVVVVPRIQPRNVSSVFSVAGIENVGARSFRFLGEGAKANVRSVLHGGIEGDSLQLVTYPNIDQG